MNRLNIGKSIAKTLRVSAATVYLLCEVRSFSPKLARRHVQNAAPGYKPSSASRPMNPVVHIDDEFTLLFCILILRTA